LASQEAFRNRLVRRLAADFPSHHAAIGDAGLMDTVKHAIKWGPNLGVETSGAISVLAELLLVYGPELRDSPDRAWAIGILSNSSMPGQLKVRLLRERLDSRSGGRLIVKSESMKDEK
jgi:hypothetical protein